MINFPNMISGLGGGGGGFGGMGGLGGAGMSPFQQSQMLMTMMQMMTQLMSMFMGGMGGVGLPMGGGFGGGGSGVSGLSNFLGAAPMGGGGGYGGGSSGGGGYGGSPISTMTNSAAPALSGPPGAPGSGQAAVDLARKYLGRDSISLKGDMPHFTAAGGVTNNCVDFVSSALESQGLVKGHHINVVEFEKQLKAQGWRQIPGNQAQPGDVFINSSRGHTELVATAGAGKLIGSNGSARQRVSEHDNNPSQGVYYTRR